MQIEIKIDSTLKEPKVIIMADRMSEEVKALAAKLSAEAPQMLAGFQEDSLKILEQTDIFRIYCNGGKVYAVTGDGEYLLRLRLYELEERLDKSSFVRISNSEIINLKKVRNFDLSFSGTICVSLSDGTVTYVSRRFVAKIKQVLGI
ncbi:MAG: LytTR family DNA-binding domain-containing protein [Lachnospiraceae bacterium]